jgi:retinol dehydrogenase-14
MVAFAPMSTMAGKTVVISGGTSGIGLEAAEKTRRSVRDIAARAGAGAGLVESALCDFASEAAIRALARELLARCPRIDVLVNNAGLVNNERTVTVDGIETTFAVNHLGYFLLTNLLAERLLASAPARVVNVSSAGHYRGTMPLSDLGFERGGYQIMRAYTRSKLGNVLFTNELARRFTGKGVTVNALHPGGVATNIWSRAPAWSQPILALVKMFFLITPEEGARTITYLAMSPEVLGKTGLYYEKNKPKPAAKLALDETLAAQLWDVSAKMVGL